jgi:hypothetical protein
MKWRLAKYTFVLILLSHWHFSHAQQTRAFKGRIMILDGSKKDLFNLSVRLVGHGKSYTGSDGIFVIPIKADVGSVTLQLVESRFDIMYPVNGTIGVPQDTAVITDFIIGPSINDLIARAVGQMGNQYKDIMNQEKVNEKVIKQAMENILTEVQKKTGINTEVMDDQMELNRKRKEFYYVLSAAINDYTNEAKDIKDAFKFISRHAFEDAQALQVLTDAINRYNVAYQELNKNHNSYEKTVGDLWGSDTKTIEVRDLFSYALGELHSESIFVLNLKIRDINGYNLGQFSGSRRSFKERILHEIESSLLVLERRLQILDTRSQVFLSRMAI